MNERREKALEQVAAFHREIFTASDTELGEKLKNAESLKLFATGIAVAGVSVMATAVGVQELTDHEPVRLAMNVPIVTGGLICSLGTFMLLSAKLTAQEIFFEAKQRGLKIVPGMHRSLETTPNQQKAL